jgi:hypothetical protein
MANVKVFADRQTDKQTDGPGQKLYAPDLSIQGHKKGKLLLHNKRSSQEPMSPNSSNLHKSF